MNCYIEKESGAVVAVTATDHGLKVGDTVRLSVTRPQKKASPDRIKALIEAIPTGQEPVFSSGSICTARARVSNVIGPRMIAVASSEKISAEDLQAADADPCQDMSGVDPIYWLTCCVMGLGCNDD